LFRDVALICLADGLVGVSFGATTVAGHLPWWVPVAMSLLVFAGGSQFAAVGVVLAGGSPFAAVAAGAVLNTRLLPYGFAVADVVGPPEVAAPDGADPDRADSVRADSVRADSVRAGSVRADSVRTSPVRASPVRWHWLIRLLGAQVITDESTAFALRQTDPAHRRAAFWTCGLSLFAIWNVSVLLGVLAGSVLRNTNAFGLDATFPAVVIALALPALADLRTRFSAGTGAVIAVALTPVLPAGLPVLAALAGLSTGWRPRHRTTAHPTPARTTPARTATDPTSVRTTMHSANPRQTTRPSSTQTVTQPTRAETVVDSPNDKEER
jgi:predicted branched-subunit amino acid permease